MTFTLLLTCTCKVQDNITWLKERNLEKRIKTYVKKIKKWIKNTNIDIVVIENSGFNFNELQKYVCDRFEIITFDYSKIDKNDNTLLKSMRSKGQHEIYSINYAYKRSKIIKKNNYLFKLTGRYFLPNFEKIINEFNYTQYSYIIQHDSDHVSKNKYKGKLIDKIGFPKRCELVGCKKELIDKFFKFPLKNDHMEQELYERLHDLSILVLPKIYLDEKTKQGCGHEMIYI